MNKSFSLLQLGQSIWFDNIDRSLLINGWLENQINHKKIYGVTSNPSIFQKVISTGTAYYPDIQTMAWSGLDTKDIYENLVISDIQVVADLLAPVYVESERINGYVSLEVDPSLAHDVDKTVSEAKRLWHLVNRDNLMIKIPATIAGISAIEKVIGAGINVNVTLIFSSERYSQVMDAYLSGLEYRLAQNLRIDHVHSVASFFVSRMDVMIEKIFAEDGRPQISVNQDIDRIKGKIGIQNALDAYKKYKKSITSKRFEEISKAGGNIQRPLWASTGTKNPTYSDVLYVNNLVLPHTVNTVPPKTLAALLDHGKVELVEAEDGELEFQETKKIFKDIGIDLHQVYKDLENEGVNKFVSSQTRLLESIENVRGQICDQISSSITNISKQLNSMKKENFISRFFQPDVSLFTKNPEEEQEVLNRMGWIEAPQNSRSIVPVAEKLLKELIAEAYTHAVVLGMGGSSLAPEVFSEVFKKEGNRSKEFGLQLSILDTTDPDQIKAKLDTIPVKKTLFISSSKSGTTAEMKSLVSYFLKILEEAGGQDIGNHFICITDPGTPLEVFAKENNFRYVFNADPNVGGRYSALIAFGLIPAILAGIDANLLLDRAESMRKNCKKLDLNQNPGFVLAAILSEAFSKGFDKLTILADERYLSFGSWLEQLVAESSGKNGKGMIPVDREPIADVQKYSEDRLFYYLRYDGGQDQFVSRLKKNGFTVLESHLEDEYDISAEMYKWEIAIAAFCCLIGVNPFNQPNVQNSKSLALKMIEKFKNSPEIEEDHILLDSEAISVYDSHQVLNKSLEKKKILENIMNPKSGDFIAINAFLPRTPANELLLAKLRMKLMDEFLLPVTLGFGPRFLHSTGQLHKGGKNNGIFVVLTQTPSVDMEIPGEGIKFSTLEKAQALGDLKALETHQRRVVRIHFKEEISEKSLSLLI